MGTFQSIIDSIQNPEQNKQRRKKLIQEIQEITGRSLLVYVADVKKYPDNLLSPEDKTGFSDLIQGIENQNVDIIINSPGGFAEVTEVIVGMLRSKFQGVRFVVPNMAKSAATLLVLSGDEILLDHRSELGPIDPQIEYPTRDGRKREAAEDILEGFQEAKKNLINEGPAATPAYIPLLDKYTVGLLRGCENAVELSKTLARKWLKKYMFAQDDPAKADKATHFFAIHSETLSHNRAILIEDCLQKEMKILDLRKPENQTLDEKIWELWCLYELHFERTPVYKIYENSFGCLLQKQVVRLQIPLANIPIPEKLPKQ
jgi:hypothetical protein